MNSNHYLKDAMVPNSEGLLKSDQNMNTPKLDVLVRESIQNSLDAATGKTVRVDYTIGEYNADNLSVHFPELRDVLSRYPHRFMCIRDSGTTGLKGPVRISEIDKNGPGNYISLVKGMMDTSKNDSNAGGSWGIGKVVYYKIGINFVIYYSRIFENGKFQSRMSAVWIDDGGRRFVPESIPNMWRGISLWGVVEKNQELGIIDVLPITDENSDEKMEINDILDNFGLEPFKDDETGTAIIIPGLNENLLVGEIHEEETTRKWWTSNIEEYLWYSIQKWFSPRLMGTESESAVLIPSINRTTKMEILPLFSKFQQLYNATLNDDVGIKRKNINIRIKKNGSETWYDTGTLAWTIVTRSDLIEKSHFDNPHDLCDINTGNDGNRAIVVYTRSLGMFVTYNDPEIERIMPKVGEDAYLLAVFRLNPETPYPHPTNDIKTIENYIRAGEKSDHFVWTDLRSYKQTPLGTTDILKRIFNNIASTLDKDVSDEEGAVIKGRRTTVGRKIAESLFPPGGHFVSNNNEMSGTGSKSRGIGKKKLATEISKFEAIPITDGVEVTADISFHDISKAEIEMSVWAPTAKNPVINRKSWEDGFKTEFPFDIESVKVLSVRSGTYSEDINLILTPDMKSAEHGRISLKWKNPTRLQISVGKRNVDISLKLLVSRPENEMTPILVLDPGDES